MANYNALEALINAYIKQNGVKAITGNILNGVLRGMVSALGKGWTIADGDATPTTDPGTMTGPVAYISHTAGTYEHFGNLVVNDGEVALLKYNEQTWTKEVIASLSATATIDGNVGTPAVNVTFQNGVLSFDFRNMKGNTGDAAGFGTINATVDGNIGTPAVSVQTSGPDTAKNMTFAFTNLKGETGVTSVVATVDNTVGTPSCAVSLVGQELHLDFTGLKGPQGDTGSSVDYPFTIVNNLTTNDATQALSAAMGVQLEGEISQLEHKVDGIDFPLTGYIRTDGTINATGGYIHTDFIPVSAGDVFYYKGRVGSVALCVSGYSDANVTNFVSALVPGGKFIYAQKIVIPSGVSYIMACSSTDTPYILIKIPKYYQDIVGRFDEYPFPYGGYINQYGTFVVIAGFQTTDYIPVVTGDSFIVSVNKTDIGDSNHIVAGYDANKAFTASLLLSQDTESGKDYLITIPSSVSYIRATANGSYPYYLVKSPSIDYLTKRIQFDETDLEDTKGVLGLLDIFTIQEAINTNGTFYSYSLARRTDFIPVKEGDVLYYLGGLSAAFLAVAGYDSSKDFVQSLLAGGEYQQTIKRIVIPSGVDYVVAGTRSSDPGFLSSYQGFEPISKCQDDIKTLTGKVAPVEDCLRKFGVLFDKVGYIKTDGTTNATLGYSATDYIPVSEGEKYYYLGGMGAVALCVAGYDGSKVFVSALISGGNTYTTLQEITIPSGMSYIRASSRDSDNHRIFKASDLLDYIRSVETKVDNVIGGNSVLINEYYGKTVNWLGDSIVAGSNFDELVASYFGMSENDYGIGGSTIAKDENNTRNSMAVRYANMSNNADVIVVSGGTNDYQYSWTPFGQMGDNTDDTFYGALDVLCRGLITKYPDKIIFFTTPIKRNQDNNEGDYIPYPLDTRQDTANSLGKYLKDYANAIKEVCAKYSIPVCDLYSESMLNPNMTAQAGYFDSIGTHPNGTGRNIMARRVRGFMKQLI